uniref:ABC transporter ATP-binding protein n=1 Tax=Ignisphaera aggregans TaxID=334771 RepID=A0A7J3QG14_9CREN
MNTLDNDNKTLIVRNLKGGYKTEYGYVRAVDGVSFDVYPREIVGIVGESGSGKTTLLKLICSGGRIPPLFLEEGDIIMDGINIVKLGWNEFKSKILGKKVAYVPQAAYDAIYPYKRIWQFYEDILREIGISVNKENEDQIKQHLIECFKSLGLDPSLINRYSFELSGGMRQRAVIALIASLRVSLPLLDEPTSALDVVTQKRVLEFIANIFREGYVKSVIISSHDVATLRQIAHRMLVMYAGKIMETAKVEDIIAEPLHPYTQLLIKSLEAFEGFKSRKEYKPKVIYRELANIYTMLTITGCRFHPRCPYAMDICRKEEPPTIKVDRDRTVACWMYMKR